MQNSTLLTAFIAPMALPLLHSGVQWLERQAAKIQNERLRRVLLLDYGRNRWKGTQ